MLIFLMRIHLFFFIKKSPTLGCNLVSGNRMGPSTSHKCFFLLCIDRFNSHYYGCIEIWLTKKNLKIESNYTNGKEKRLREENELIAH